jgi:hypothetical protein
VDGPALLVVRSFDRDTRCHIRLFNSCCSCALHMPTFVVVHCWWCAADKSCGCDKGLIDTVSTVDMITDTALQYSGGRAH